MERILHTELTGPLVECELARVSQLTLQTPHIPRWYQACQITPILHKEWVQLLLDVRMDIAQTLIEAAVYMTLQCPDVFDLI